MSWETGLQPDYIPYFEWLMNGINYYDPSVRVSSAFRSSTEQARLYRRYLAGTMAGPVAPPGHSKHELGLAIDVWSPAWEREFDPYNPPQILQLAGSAWQAIGGTWGGDFRTVAPDPIHFEV